MKLVLLLWTWTVAVKLLISLQYLLLKIKILQLLQIVFSGSSTFCTILVLVVVVEMILRAIHVKDVLVYYLSVVDGMLKRMIFQMLLLLLVMLLGIHLDDQLTMARIDILRIENTAILLEATGCFVPAIFIEVMEVISPFENKFISRLFPIINFHVVVEDIPWHVFSIKSISELIIISGSPKVHSKRLRFIFKPHSIVSERIYMLQLDTINFK